MLQHPPDPERAFHALCRLLKPGGEIVIDIYTRSLVSLVQWKYLLRSVTKRMDTEKLYRIIGRSVGMLLPTAKAARELGGSAGARLIPVVQYSHLGLSDEMNREWAILDTFDMYSPAHDHPKSVGTVRRWFEDAGLENVAVGKGANGVVGRARRPGSGAESGGEEEMDRMVPGDTDIARRLFSAARSRPE